MLPLFLKEFVPKDCTIVAGPELCMCQGPGSGEHLYIKGEGRKQCVLFNEMYCHLCVVDTKKRETLPSEWCCVQCCAAHDVMIPGDHNIITTDEMRDCMQLQNYGGNVAKGGVFVQLCGWLGTVALWTDGAVNDTDYFSNSGILDMQTQLVAASSEPNKPFTNILDKGYRNSIMAAWCAGKHLRTVTNILCKRRPTI
jgi:hypothetical protein